MGTVEKISSLGSEIFFVVNEKMKIPLKTIVISLCAALMIGSVGGAGFLLGKAQAATQERGETHSGVLADEVDDEEIIYGRPVEADIVVEEDPAQSVALPSDGSAAELTALPEVLAKLARRLKVSPSDIVISVRPLESPEKTLLGINDNVLEKPASTAKLVTTLAALETLGPTWRWKTDIYALGSPDASGRLEGGLFVRGGGDPALVIEDFALEVDRLAQLGIKHIEGDIQVDRSYFDLPKINPNAFDGRGSRPYNLPPDAALINYRALTVELIPDEAVGIAHVVATPQMAGIELPETIPLQAGKCGRGRSAPGFRLKKGENGNRIVEFTGSFTAACGPSKFTTINVEPDEYFERVFRFLWERNGRTWSGHVVPGTIPADAHVILSRPSPTMVETIALTNKWSNNMMARDILLTLGAERVRRTEGRVKGAMFPRGATVEDARAALADWLKRRGIAVDEIQIDNGSGLSRETRVTGRAMTRVLVAGWTGPYMPEYLASLPITGRDGTMRRRRVALAEGRIKTGFLADVRSIGGYIHSKSGARWAVYASVKGKSAINGGIPFLNGVIDWVYKQ